MTAFYNPELINKIQHAALVPDTNIISSLSLDVNYFQNFMSIFAKNSLLLDPIVKLEFLRGAFNDKIYEKQKGFLEYARFINMIDNHDIQMKIYENTFNIARIYSHQGNSNIPLGDVFIIARLVVYDNNVLFLTRDYKDFGTVLFDRIGIISIERKLKNKLGPEEIVEHVQILQFNQTKYKNCLDSLPQ